MGVRRRIPGAGRVCPDADLGARRLKHLDWYIAWRYLASRKRGRLLSLITWIALAGVTVGVTALIVVIGVMTGMQQDLRAKILGSTPHILVLQQGNALRMGDWQRVLDSARAVPGVVAASPFVLTQVTLRREDYAQSADLYGVALESLGPAVTEMEEAIRSGVHDLRSTAPGIAPVLVGSGLAARLQVFNRDTVLLVSMENLRPDLFGALTPHPAPFPGYGHLHDRDVRLRQQEPLYDH